MVKVRDAKLKDREASQDFIRTSKKHRNQAWLAFAILVIFYVACSAFYVGYRYKKQPVFEPTDFDEAKMDASYRPNGAKLTNIVIPNSEDKDAMIACALKLYNKANLGYIQLQLQSVYNHFCFYTVSPNFFPKKILLHLY